MPPSSKRKIAGRAAAAHARNCKKRQKISTVAEIPDSCSEGGALSSGDSEGIAVDSEPEDDVFVFHQLDNSGWTKAEQQLKGYSKTNAGKTTQSRWYYSQKKKNQEKETAKLQKTYGSISRFFGQKEKEDESTLLAINQNPLHLQTEPRSPSPPPYLRAETKSLSPPLLPPPSGWGPSPPGLLFAMDEVFFGSTISFKDEVKALENWQKEKKKEIIGDWQKRVLGVIDLLQFHGSFVSSSVYEIEERRRRWREFSESIAVRLGKGPKYAQALRRWERDWVESRIPPPCPMRGKNIKRKSLFGDEGVILAVREYLNTALWHANPRGVCEAVQQYLQNRSVYDIMRIDTILTDTDKSDGGGGISERTAQRWLIKMGWIYGRNKKGYCDGHERKDVVQYRNEIFGPRMIEIYKTLREYNDVGEIPKSVPMFTRRRHLITHDESTFNANDSPSYSWKKNGCEWLKPKSKGKGLMVSEFLCAVQGRLSCWDPKDQKQVYATEIIKYGGGKTDEGWWNAEKMVEQTKKAIQIFNTAFPDDIAVFAFDNSSGHACKALNALVASRMNLGPGGKQPQMHDTTFVRKVDGIRLSQHMVFQRGDYVFGTDIPIPAEMIGTPKGMKRILQERGLWNDRLKKQCGWQKKAQQDVLFSDRLFTETIEQYEARTADRCETGKGCCALRILEAEDDFYNEKSLLETIILEAGHEVIFYPKFHCELNYIEYYWAALKRYTRENCKYSFAELEKTVFAAMESVDLRTIRRFADRSKRWLMLYMEGLDGKQREYAEKQYKSHRRTCGQVFM